MFRPQFDIQEFYFPMEVTSLDFQIVCRAGDVPVILAELSGNIFLFERIPRLSKRVVMTRYQAPARARRGRVGGGLGLEKRHGMGLLDGRPGNHDHQSFNQVSEFPGRNSTFRSFIFRWR